MSNRQGGTFIGLPTRSPTQGPLAASASERAWYTLCAHILVSRGIWISC